MNTATTLKSSFDLSAFDQLPHGTFGTSSTSTAPKPDNQLNVILAIPLSQIIEDKNQPRKDFHDEHWLDFVSDIKRRGVQTPIHVRPTVEGIYTIIHGARRYRASLEAELSTIAAIVQQDAVIFDDYSQVLENTKRANMAAMDIALFIKKRIAAGDSKGKIAELLSESASYISFHLALTEMPALVETAYKAGKVKGAQLVYQLNKLYDESPRLTESIISHHDEITNALILQARKSLEADTDSTSTLKQADGDNATTPLVTIQTLPYYDPNKAPASTQSTEPSKIKKPLLLAYYQGNQSCVVMLHERPTEVGFVWIKLDDTGKTIEVLAKQVKLSMLTEAQGRE
jgi:ParB family chromosome partitioning protein